MGTTAGTEMGLLMAGVPVRLVRVVREVLDPTMTPSDSVNVAPLELMLSDTLGSP